MSVGRGKTRERTQAREIARVLHAPKLRLRRMQELRRAALRKAERVAQLGDRARDVDGEGIRLLLRGLRDRLW